VRFSVPAASSTARKQPAPRLLESRRLLTIILIAVFLWSVATVDWGGRIIHGGGLRAVFEIVTAMFQPVLTADVLRTAFFASWRTVAYAVTGLTIALVIAFPLGVIASGVLNESRWMRALNVAGVRFVLAFFRSIHELVWAWLFVAALGLSPMAAVLALGIPYGGLLGRIYSELLQDVPQAPLQALRSTGAGPWKVFWYGRLPMAFPDMLSYTFYRLECGIRSAAILGWIGLGGLGFNIQVSLADLNFERAWTFIWALIILVVLVDIWSTLVRRRLTA
jgi:phosphonate transport system permease protein